MIKRMSILTISWFPVILVTLQVLANVLYFIDADFYYRNGMYLNMAVGTNLLFPLFMLAVAFSFKFCYVSRAAAIAECLFAAYYLIFQKDDIYNIVFQITVGGLALVITLYYLTRRSKVVRFIITSIGSADCEKGIEKYLKNH